MKARLVLVCFLLLSCVLPQRPALKELRSYLKGEWVYKYSCCIDGESRQLGSDTHFPVSKMVFSECNDLKDLKDMPSYVMDARQKNVLKNLKCEAFNAGNVIDTYFPVAYENEDRIGIANYGLKLKSSYNIYGLSADTLVLADGKVYFFGGKKYSGVKHIYYKLN